MQQKQESLFRVDEGAYLLMIYVATAAGVQSKPRDSSKHALFGVGAFGSVWAPMCVNRNLALDWWVHLCNYIQPSHLLWQDICHQTSSSRLECQVVGVSGERRWKIVSFQHTCRELWLPRNKCLSFFGGECCLWLYNCSFIKNNRWI